MPDLLRFEEVGIGDIAVVGGKNASLGEMVRNLRDAGVRVPSGFAVTADAFREFIAKGGLTVPIAAALADWRRGAASLADTGLRIRSLILDRPLPPALAAAIRKAYRKLGRGPVAVRSSATAEDLKGASFAGQQDTFLNVRGQAALLDACRRCFASLFTDRAIAYRDLKGFGQLDVALSVGVQKMVRSDRAGAGVMFTLDTETGFPRVVTISAAWGLGEAVVQGIVDPDQYMVFKPLLDVPGATPIIEKRRGAKAVRIVYAPDGTRQRPTPPKQRRAFVLSDAEVLQLARWGMAIERHYGVPMDIEWAKDADSGELFILQARPETVQAGREKGRFEVYRLTGKGPVLASGRAVGTAIAAGPARIVRDEHDLADFRDGEILVAEATRPDWLPVLKRAAGVVTDHGGTTSHAAIVSRELGLPAVVGTGDGTRAIGTGAPVTLSCASGARGVVYTGRLPFEREAIDVGGIPPTRTALMVNLASPDAALQWWRLPARGVGLARMEFIIDSSIRAHPMALAHPERLSIQDRGRIRRLTAGYPAPGDFFVDVLSRGIAKLAAPWHPHPCIVRLSDFKSNEYAGLIGGSVFEEAEENPMLGFRGASRYDHPRYRDGFALECRAIRRARDELGFRNIVLMVPFCRTLAEADQVLRVMAENGLARGRGGLQVYVMCEVPSNVILAREFAKRFDGFSIGSNDLTQLVLGIDRDSALLAASFDESNAAVTTMIGQVIGDCHEAGVKIGICGQAPSDKPDFAAFLVEGGIDSISLNPDSFARTAAFVAAAEGRGRPASTAPATPVAA